VLDLLIHGGSVVDGSGAPASRGDVGIADGRIVEVGRVDQEAKVTIDGDGLVVAPGFIDLHSHYDAQLFWDPTLSPSPLHGVTTAVSGNCGLTLAPAAPDDRDFLTRLLARVEALLAGVSYEWESFAELLDVIEAKPLALNIGFMVGHSAIRRAVMGPAASTDKASPAQIEAMRVVLGAALAAGGFGFSTANVATQVDGDGRPTPPNLADPGEFIALAAECGLHPGTSIEFIPGSFLSGFSDDDVELMADMSAAANRHLNWNTPLINRAVPDLYQRQLGASDVARARGGWIVPMFMPQNGPLRHDVLARPGDAVPVALASTAPLRVDHGDLFAKWVVHDFVGAASRATPATKALGSRLAPFVTDLARHGEPGPSDAGEVELLCVLWASYMLGVAEHALELAVAHVKSRVQFGRPLAELQSVRFGVADATVAVDGLRELVRFTTWRVATDPASALSDALAARLSAQEVAQPVLRLAQQLHGASGLCDEYDISVLVRHVQPALRLPVDSDAMSDILFDAIATHGFATLFPLRSADVGRTD
jgi:hypothetical protein